MEEVFGVSRETWQHLHVFIRNLFEHFLSGLLHHEGLFERINTAYHLIEKHTQAPEVHSEGMSRFLDNLRSDILRSPAKSVCEGIIGKIHFW